MSVVYCTQLVIDIVVFACFYFQTPLRKGKISVLNFWVIPANLTVCPACCNSSAFVFDEA